MPKQPVRWLPLSLLTACYAPHVWSGAPCAIDVQCPEDQRCVTGVCRAADDVLVDAGPAAIADAPTAPSLDARTGGATPPSCASAATCIAAPLLGTVSGDTGQQMLIGHGSGSAWFHVRVTENDTASVSGHALRVSAQLTSPTASWFAVTLYVDPTRDALDCATRAGTAITDGEPALARASWGEQTVANGADDSRTIAVEIQPLAADCAPDATWMLTITGNAS